MGPVSLAPFSGQLAQALTTALPGLSVHFDQAALEWSRENGRVDLVILGAKVLDSHGRIIADAPKADLRLSPSALMRGKVVVQRITLVGVQLTLVRTRDGALRLGVSRDKNQIDLIAQISDAIKMNSSSGSALQSFAVSDARLAFSDQTSGLFLVAPRATLRVDSIGPDLLASVDADVEVTGKQAHLAANVTVPPHDAPVTGHFAITGLDLHALGRNSKTFAALQAADMVVNISANVRFLGAKKWAAGVALDGHGQVEGWGPKGTPLQLGTFHATGTYDASTGRAIVDNGTLTGGQVSGHLVGADTLNFDDNGNLTETALDAVADHLGLNFAGMFPRPLNLAHVRVAGRYLPDAHEADVSRVEIDSGPLRGTFSGNAIFAGGISPAVDLNGHIDEIATRSLLAYWPLHIGGGARDWIARNVTAGRLGPFTITAHIPTGAIDKGLLPDNALSVTFPIHDSAGVYLHGLTPMTAVQGDATLTGDAFAGRISSARIGVLALSGGKVVIPNLHQRGTVGDIIAHVDGQMPDVLKLLDMKPLGYPTRFHINPVTTTGTAALDLDLHIPMLADLSVDQVGIAVKAHVMGLNLALGSATKLMGGNVDFTIGNHSLHAVGTTRYANLAVSLDWTEDFDATQDITTHVLAKTVVDDAARKAMGIDTGEYLSGPVGVSAVLQGHRGILRHADLTLDLTKAAISFAPLAISKPVGTAASGTINADFTPNGAITTAAIAVNSAPLSATGTASFNANGGLARLTMTRIVAGPANDFGFDYTRGYDSGVTVAVKGHSLDASALTKRGNAKSDQEDKFDGPFRLSVQLDRVALREGAALAPVSLETSGFENRPRTLSLKAGMAHGATLRAAMTASGSTRQLNFDASDAGELLNALFGFSSIKGGSLNLAVIFPRPAEPAIPLDDGKPDYEAVATLKDFRVLHQPFLARLFAAGSLTSFIDLMGGQGIQIDTLKVPFTSKAGVLTVRDAHASGPAIGINADGYVDRPKNTIALRGTMAPLYGINSVLGVLPLVGNILTSKKGEGIVGVTYTASGNADEPDVNVNPLSILTPGILRRIFEGKIPTEQTVGSPNSPKKASPVPQKGPPQKSPKP